MKKRKNLRDRLFMMLGMSMTIFLLVLVLVSLPTIIPAIAQTIEKTTEAVSEINDSKSDTTIVNTEVKTDILIEETEKIEKTENITSKPRSYVEQCELPYVAPPEKQDVEEAIEAIKELSRYYPGMYIVYKNTDKYPDQVLKSLASNPEMLDYCIGYLTSDGSVTGGITEEEKPQDHPLFLQWDKRWGYMPYGSVSNVAASGCGPTCLSMVVYYLTGDTSATPDDAASYSLEQGYYVEGVGTAWALLDKYPTGYGLKVKHPSLSEENLKAHLDKGNYLICSMKPGDFTSEGHFVVIYDYDENGFKINDPKCVYRSRLTWSYEQIKDDIKRVWSIGK